MRCTVQDVMTRDVVCAREDTPYKELVKLQATRRVSAVPVVDFDVDVHDGVVVLQGRCERRSLIPTVVQAVAAVEGVVRVENRLGYDLDDTTPPRPETFTRSAL